MPLTDSQKRELIERYWTNPTPRCPGCSESVRLRHQQHTAGYILSGNCLRCGSIMLTNADDPLSDQFRPWTQEEADVICSGRTSKSTCPVDGVNVNVKLTRHSGGTIYSATCPRCSGHAVKNHANS